MTAATINPSLAALPPLNENPHRGFEAAKRIPHPAPALANPLTASGLSTCYYDSRVGPRCTGKERGDALSENGLDYFGARYFSGAQGRFTSADAPLIDQYPEDPQSWNLYGYVRNNPLKFVDLNGRNYTLCTSYGDCVDMADAQYEEWRKRMGNSIIVRPAGDILDHETEQKIGSAQRYDLSGLEALQKAGHMASRNVRSFMVASAIFATAYVSTYAVPAAVVGLAAMNEIGAVGPGVAFLKEATERGSKLVKQFKVEGVGQGAGRSGGHGTPFIRAGAELIRQANQLAKNDPLRAALKQVGERLIEKGKSINRKRQTNPSVRSEESVIQ